MGKMKGPDWVRRVKNERRVRTAGDVAIKVYNELFRTRAFTIAAAMAFYSILSLMPLLIVISALLGYLPIPHLFQQLLDLMATVVPPDAMSLVKQIVAGVLTPNRGGLLSFGVLGYLWTASGAFATAIEALNIAYDVKDQRSWWRDRIQALVLTLTTGGLSLVALFCVVAGPHFGHFLTMIFPVPQQFGEIWPVLRTVTTFVSVVVAVEVLYYLGPNQKQRFLETLPGAIVAVFGFFVGSAIMDYYFAHFANYNKTYGSLGAVIILMLWFYAISLFILIGAELNAELAKRTMASRAEGASHAEDLVRPEDLRKRMPGMPAA